MTNEQLIVLLEGFIAQLGRAIAEAEALLPEDVERHTMNKYIGPHPFMVAYGGATDDNPDHWKRVERSGDPVIALDPLREFLERLALHITTLEGIK